jgi:hypothetical protein
MPNLIPDSVLGRFYLGWTHPMGRLIFALLVMAIALLFVAALIRPPLEHKLLTVRQGVPLVIGLVVVSYVLGALIDPLQVFFVWVSIFGTIVLALTMVVSRDPRPADLPTTWSEAMLGAVAVFGMMALAYGIIPHEWITFSDKYLQWTPDKIFIDSYPIKVNYQAVRDVIVVLIYVVFLGLNLRLFAMWQTRLVPKAEAEAEAKPSRLSRFGRPLRSRAKV